MQFLIALLLSSNMAFATTTNVELKGMMCGSCIKSVKKAVATLPNADKVKFTIKENMVKIEDKKNQLSKAEKKQMLDGLKKAVKDLNFEFVKATEA